MIRRILAAALAVVALSIGDARAQTVTLTFGGSDAIGSILDRQNAMFTRLVNERAGGRLRINFIQGEQLGTDMQVIEQMQQGAVHLYGDVLDWYANWVRDFSILSWGFTFRDLDHLQRFVDSPMYQQMANDLLQRTGLRVLAAAGLQPRVMFSTRPITNVSDLQGLKMRVPEIRSYVKLWETLGTQPSRVAWAEVFLAMRTGVVDAAEGPISAAFAARMHEAGRNVLRTNHIYSTAHITINNRAFERLAPDLQQLLTQAARESVAWARTTATAETDDVYRQMTAAGASVTTINLDGFRERSNAAVREMEGEGGLWSAGLWQRIQGL